MPQNELSITNATVNPETGFLEFHPDYSGKKSFNSEAKVNFLKSFELIGNQAQAMEAAGFSHRILPSHLKVDKEFAAAFRAALESMEYKLTGTMYQNGLTPRGTLDRFGWLRAHNPAKWAPKAASSDYKPDKEKINDLFKDAIDITPLQGESNETKET